MPLRFDDTQESGFEDPRFDDSLYRSQIFRDWQLLEQAATEKETDFVERGWK